MAKITPAISSRMPAVNSRRADNCSILGIPFCAKIVLHPVDVPGTNCNVPQGLSHCSGRHWCIQRHQKQCRPHLVGNIVFRHTTAFFFCRRPVDHSIFMKLGAWQIHGEKYLHQLPKRAVLPGLPISHTASRYSFVPPTGAKWPVHDRLEEVQPIGTMDLLR